MGELRDETDADRAIPALAGRDDALAKVLGGVDRSPALVLVEGEPGIGKTRLLEEVLRSESVTNRRAMLVTCPPLREPFPLGPVVDGVRRLRERVREVEPLPLGLSRLCGALQPLFPEWADELPPELEELDDPRETRHRLLRALTELVERLSVEVLVVEDAHWADSATLEWLLTMSSVADHVMSIVVTYRPTDVPTDSLLRRLTARTPTGMTGVRVELEPLNVPETRQLIGSMFGSDAVSEEFAAFVHERTDGVPLAVEESIRLLRDRHDIVRHDGRWSRRLLDELEVPPTVRDSVLERVARLPAEAQRLLEAAAVLAEPADENLLTTVAGLEGPRQRHVLAVALTSGVLREVGPGRYGFRHVLDCRAVELATPASERRRLHRRAGEALQAATHPPVVRLNRHFRAAGDAVLWCQYAERTADLAMRSSDDRTAVTVLLEVLAAVDVPGDQRARLARKLGEAAAHGLAALGDLGERTTVALRDALAVDDLPDDARGELRLLLGRFLMQLGEFDAAYTEIEASLPDLADQPALAARAMLFLAVPLSPAWPASRHVEWLGRATPLLPRIEPAWERTSCLADRAMILLLLGEEAGWQAAEQLPATASTRAELQEIARGMLNVGQYAIAWGRFVDARRYLANAADAATTSGFQRLMAAVHVARALLDWYSGQWEGLSARVTEVAETDDARLLTRTEARLLQNLVDLAHGEDRDGVERRLSDVLDDISRRGFVEPGTALPAAALGRIYVANGQLEKALEATGPIVDTIARKGVWLWATDVAPVSCHALVGVGDQSRAEQLTRDFATGLGDLAAPAPQAALATCHAILAAGRGDPGRATTLFAAAAAAWAAIPRPYDELIALEQQGRSALSAGERDTGVKVLTDVEPRLRELGARWDANRVAHALRQEGVEVSRVWRRGPRGYGDQLSPREREVLVLVAQGLTNREAGEVLFLSPRTVGRHLGTAMRKLGVSSRTAAAMAATEAGLI